MQKARWAVTALAAALAAVGSTFGAAQAQETIKIGMTQPLTGPVAASGNGTSVSGNGRR